MNLNTILKNRGLPSLAEYDELMQNQSFVSTGYPSVDAIINPEGGGFPRGSLSEIYGASRSGKSRFMRDICVRDDVEALYIDTENSLSTKEYNYMRQHGVEIIAEQLLENIWGVVNDCIDEDAYDLIVVDSIGATTTQAEQDDDNTLSMSSGFQRAKILSKWLRGLNSHIVGKRTALVFVNHAKPGVGAFATVTKPGGKSIDFHAMVQLMLTGGDSTISGTRKKLDVKCTKTRYNIVGQVAHEKIDLNPYKEIKKL